MTPGARLHALELALKQISATQHALEKKKTSLREQTLRLRVSLSPSDAAEYEGLTKERVSR